MTHILTFSFNESWKLKAESRELSFILIFRSSPLLSQNKLNASVLEQQQQQQQ